MNRNLRLAILLMVVFAAFRVVTRLCDLLPPNFSVVYALVFCAGVFFPRTLAWWLPFVTLLATDLALNVYYQFALGYPCFTPLALLYMTGNYAGYAALIWLGQKLGRKASFITLLGGGILGALLFYFITNTLSWLINPFSNPEYHSKTIFAWLWALTKGTGGWPDTWMFFKNTLLSGGLFTALFAGAMKLADASEPKEAEEPEEAEADAPEPKPDEAKA